MPPSARFQSDDRLGQNETCDDNQRDAQDQPAASADLRHSASAIGKGFRRYGPDERERKGGANGKSEHHRGDLAKTMSLRRERERGAERRSDAGQPDDPEQ